VNVQAPYERIARGDTEPGSSKNMAEQAIRPAEALARALDRTAGLAHENEGAGGYDRIVLRQPPVN
jgi:hypothetical protein